MDSCKHEYRPAKRGYFKQTGKIGGLGLPTYDQSISYASLYCSKCGEMKEVVWADHRKQALKDSGVSDEKTMHML